MQILFECDAVKEPQSDRAYVLLPLASVGPSKDFKFARLCSIHFKVAPLMSAELDEHKYAMVGFSLKALRQICLEL